MISCDKRLPLDTWDLSGPQENVFANPRSTFELSQTPFGGILHSKTPSAHLSQEMKNELRCEHNPNADICPLCQWTFHRVLFGQQRQQKSELQFDKFTTRSSIFYWKVRFEKPGDNLFGFSIGGCVMDQRSRDGRVIGGIKIFAIHFWKEFSRLRDVGCENCFCFD